MSRNSRRKRAGRPWQNPDALKGLDDLMTSVREEVGISLPGYEVRVIPGERAGKDYVCPECGNVVPAGEAHVVVWPEYDSDLRRHWHRHCWRLEVRRSTGA